MAYRYKARQKFRPFPESYLRTLVTVRTYTLKREETKSPNLYQVETPASLYGGSYDRTPVKAWSDRVDRSRSDSPNQAPAKVGMNSGDVQLQDISAEEEKGTSNTSLLESESVYIPVSDGEVTPPRPETAPPAVNKSLPQASEPNQEQRPTTAMTDKNDKPQENRPIKTLTQEAIKSRLAARFKQQMAPKLAQAYKSQSLTEDKVKHSEDKSKRKRSAHSTASESESDVSDSGSSKGDRIMKRASRRNAEGKENVADNANMKNPANLRVKMHSPSLSMYSPRVQPEKEHKHKFPTQMTGDEIFMNGFSDFDENNPGFQLNKAAVVIQSFWRGYLARTKDKKIIDVRQEIRARRAEDHIRFLRAELERSAINYEQEKKLRNLQLEAIKFLWREVQTLQKWREETSGEVAPHGSNGKNGQVSLMDGGSENASFPSVLASETACSDQGHTQLVNMCAKLQSQVSQLQETLSTVTNYVFQGSVSAGTDRDEDPIQVLADISETPVKSKYRSTNAWEVVSNILAEASATPTPLPGTPIPPSDVLVSHKGDSSVVVQWVASRVLTADGKDSHRPVIGYRVYVNDLPKGMVAGIKTRAFIDGLDPKAQHKIYLRAVSALGESFNSNIVTIQKSSSDTPTKGPRNDARSQGPNDQKPPTSRSRQSSGGSTKGDTSSEGRGQGSDGEHRHRKGSSSSRRSSDAGSTKDDDMSESSPKNTSMSAHTPKIIPPYRKLREREDRTTDSDDGGTKDVTPDSSPSPVVKTHRRNRSIEKSNHQPLPDKLQEADLKAKVGQEPHSPGSDKENINIEAGSPPGTGEASYNRPPRAERQRSTSLSEDTPSRDSPTGLAKSSSSESVAKQFLRSCSPSPSDSLPHRATHKEQQSLNKLQRSINDMSELTSETTEPAERDVHSRISVGRSGSLKSHTKPDRYRLSPTSDLIERQRKPGSGRSSPVIQIRDEQDKENAEHSIMGGSLRHSMDTSDTREHRPVTVRRSSSLKAKLLLHNDPGDEHLSAIHRSGSVRSRLLPDKCDLGGTTGSDSGDRSGPSSPSATQKAPENVLDGGEGIQSQQRKVIIREKKHSLDEGDSSPKSKIKSGLISKLKSHFPPK